MLRFISLVTVRDGADLGAIVTAGAAMCRDDPDIRDGTVAAGLGLMRGAGAPEADYSMVLDFADADAMNRWAAGPAHQKLLETVGDAAESFVVTQFAI